MRFKKTRIVFSALCGMLCLLVIGWWVQGQSTCTFITCNVSQLSAIQIGCLPGSLFFYWMTHDETTYEEDVRNGEIQEWEKTKRWEVESYPADQMILAYPTDSSGKYSKVWGNFSLRGEPKAIPFWFLTLLTGITVAVSFPWRQLGWQFSLRTLLITMTAVAVGLGFIVWMAKK